MTNVRARMTNESPMRNNEQHLRHSGFVIDSSFGWSLPAAAGHSDFGLPSPCTVATSRLWPPRLRCSQRKIPCQVPSAN